MNIKILKALRHEEDFISGQKLSELLGVSRTAIWKNINKLKEEGYIIESVSGKGYKLIESPDTLSEKEVKPFMNTKIIGKEMEYLKTVGSTNDYMKEKAKDSKEGLVIISEEQTKGKGRLSREWSSEKEKGLYMSILLKPDMRPEKVMKLTQVIAIAIVEGLEENGVETKIKWPNDIILNNKKIAGILIEMSCEALKIEHLIIGVGININLEKKDIDEELRKKGTSLRIESGKVYNRKKILASILNIFDKYYLDFKKENESEDIIKKSKKYSILIGKKVNLIKGNEVEECTVIDIGNDGELVVKDESGRIKKIRSGEVSVRGRDGYI